MCEIMDGQLSWFDLDTSSGKTCLEHSPVGSQEEQTSKPSLRKSSKLSAKKRPLFLSLKRDGLKPGASAEWVTADAPFPSPGEYTTRSFGESPREENASRLSQILEDSAPQKYYLSERACAGILNRAQKRGKELPHELREALEQQICCDPQN